MIDYAVYEESVPVSSLFSAETDAIVLVGIPGSGKSTLTEILSRYIRHEGTEVVVYNRDTLRRETPMYRNESRREYEDRIVSAGRAMIRAAGMRGAFVIHDNTNCNEERFIEEVCNLQDQGFEFITVVFMKDSLNVDMCHKRNVKREDSVPPYVLENMYQSFFPLYAKYCVDGIGNGTKKFIPKAEKNAIICDMDGTLAIMPKDRSPYTQVGEEVIRDSPNPPVLEYIRIMQDTHRIIIFTARNSSVQLATEKWLQMHGVRPEMVCMRVQGDSRPDFEVKFDMYMDNVYKKYNVKLVLDDRNQIVRMWRAMGLPCWQVNNGCF